MTMLLADRANACFAMDANCSFSSPFVIANFEPSHRKNVNHDVGGTTASENDKIGGAGGR